MIDKDAILERQRIDCCCNDCKYLVRDFEKTNKHKDSYKGTGLSDRFVYGNCSLKNEELFFSPNSCQPENQKCFVHRKD